MSGNIYWRGRSKAIKSKKEKVVEVKKKKERSLTQKIRDAKRLLAKPDLPEDLRKEKQVLLEGLERMRNEQLLHEKERKFAKMYHKVKFFERQKLTRRIKQIRKDLLKIEEAKAKGDSAVSEVVASLGDNQEGLNQKLEKYQGDLKYILNFPNSEKYISIVKDIKDPIVLEKRNSIRHQIFSQPNLRTGESDEEDEEMGLGEEFDEEEEEEEEERGNGNKKRKEKFVWQPDAKKGGNKTAKRNAPKSRHEEAEADDEDDKEEVEKKQMKKPPRKKSRIEPESTSTDPQEYGDDIPTLEKDDFFLTGTSNTKSVAGEDSGDVEVKEGRKRQRSDGNKKANEKPNVKKQKSNNISSNNTNNKKTPKEEPRGKKNPVKPAVQKEVSKPQQQQQKTQPAKEKQATTSPKPKPKAEGVQSPAQRQLQKGNGASPAKGKTEGSRSPRQQPQQKQPQQQQQQQQKKNPPSTPKGQKRKLETAEDDNKVEEVPSRRKRRSGGGFDLPTPAKGEKEVAEKADTPKQKLHIRFD